jgi:hypothetical protein
VLRVLQLAADKRDRYRNYAHRSDVWGRGLTKSPIYVGLVGEYATVDYCARRGFRCPIDLSLHPWGDGGRDMVIEGLTIQVKTRRKGIGRRSLIRRGDAQGRILPLTCEVFVFCQWDETGDADPSLLGWIWAMQIYRTGYFERSPIVSASHWNLRILDTTLLPMNRLIDELEYRRRSR